MDTTQNNKKSLGFYVCSLAFSFERFAFYSAKWLIAAFVAATILDGGLGLTPEDGAKMTANLVAFTYAAPIFGSIISDRFIGARYLVPVGMAFMGAGYLLGWQAQDANAINLMIILVSIGTGLFKPQTNAITGRLFKNKEELDGAFTTQYSFVNMGSFVGTTVIGMIALSKGFRFSFLICAAMMFFNTVFFTIGWKFLGEAGKKPFKHDENTKKEEKVDKTPLTKIEKQRVAAIVLISAFSVIFWIFWYLAYMPIYYHWAGEGGHANWMIGSFQVPTSWFDSLNALCCIIMGPILGSFWEKRAKRPKGDWNMFQKTSIGMLLLGIAYVVFAMADVTRGAGKASLLWLVAFGVLLSLGEMVFSPLGNSFITKFAPARILSVMMAVWTLAVFCSGKLYGDLYALTRKFPFATSYFTIAAIAIASAIILWLLNGKLNSLVREDVEDATK